MNWSTTTRCWVAEGLIEPAQAQPLTDWLETHHPAARHGERWVTIAAAAAAWLTTGTAVSALSLSGLHHQLEVVVACALVHLCIGLAARLARLSGLARGVESAAVIPLVWVVAWWGRDLWPTMPWLLAVVLAPAAVATVVSVIEGRSALGVAAAIAAVGVLWPHTWVLGFPYQPLVVVMVLAWVTIANAGAVLWPRRAAGPVAAVPPLVFLAIAALIAEHDNPVLRMLGSPERFQLYASIATSGLASWLVVLGGIGRNGATKVSALATLVFAECMWLVWVGDLWVTVAVLGTEALLLGAAAVVAASVMAYGRWRPPHGSLQEG